MSPSPIGAVPTALDRRPGRAARGRLLVCAAALAAATGCNALALPAPPSTAFTSFAADNVLDLDEHRAGGDLSGDGFTVRASVPEIPNADPLTQRLTEIVDREAADFRHAVDEAERMEVDWELTAASEDLIAVRLIRTEVDHRGSHDSYATYYYDTRTGRTAYSTELLGGDTELRELNRLVAAELEDPAQPGALHPGFRLYDSLGFNSDGDLVAEFDTGRVAPIQDGRVAVVVDATEARPLLSELGERALAASKLNPRAFSVDSAPQDSPSPDAALDEGDVPGAEHGGGDPECGIATPCVALTFDDGPSKGTGQVLETLAEYDAEATFFLSGNAIRNRPELVGRAWSQGHEIGNHGESHESFSKLSRAELDAELTTVDALMRRETGVRSDIVRPPYGNTDPEVAEAAADNGQAQIIWDTDSDDWNGASTEEIVANVTTRTPPNGLVLMHDTEANTVEALPAILEHFQSQGYAVVTVSDLFGDTEPGEPYYSSDPATNDVCIQLEGCPL